MTLACKSHDSLPAHEATGTIAGFPHEPHLPFIRHHVRNDIDINQGCDLDPEVLRLEKINISCWRWTNLYLAQPEIINLESLLSEPGA